MYDVMITSYNCYISGIMQSFRNTFTNMHQYENINTFILRKAKIISHNMIYAMTEKCLTSSTMTFMVSDKLVTMAIAYK